VKVNWPAVLRIVRAGWEKGGFTVSLLGVQKKTGDSGFMVSLAGFEARFSNRPSKNKVRQYIRRNYRQLCGRFLGGWFDDETDEYFLDVSIHIEDREEALRIAGQHGQKAIRDLASGADIKVSASEPVLSPG